MLQATLRSAVDATPPAAGVPAPAPPAETQTSSMPPRVSAESAASPADDIRRDPPAVVRPPEPEPTPAWTPPDAQDAPTVRQVAPPGAPTEATGPAVQMPLVDDPEFYPARLLDVLPRPLAEVALRYPDSAATQDVSGRVVLLLLIDELGVVVEATVIEAEPPGYFEEAAIESFRDVLFQPAQRNGRAVKSRLPVEVTFDARTDSAKP